MRLFNVVQRFVDDSTREIFSLTKVVQHVSCEGCLADTWQSSKVDQSALVLQAAHKLEELDLARDEVLHLCPDRLVLDVDAFAD